jgi:hypothetical protein
LGLRSFGQCLRPFVLRLSLAQANFERLDIDRRDHPGLRESASPNQIAVRFVERSESPCFVRLGFQNCTLRRGRLCARSLELVLDVVRVELGNLLPGRDLVVALDRDRLQKTWDAGRDRHLVGGIENSRASHLDGHRATRDHEVRRDAGQTIKVEQEGGGEREHD